MTPQVHTIELITPCFCAGADQAKAEIRVPSIRGQLRWWFRALGGSPEEEKIVFGGVHKFHKKDQAIASPVVLRIPRAPSSSISASMRDLRLNNDGEYLIWPLRKEDDARGILDAGTGFDLQVAWRRNIDTSAFDNALRAWSLLGSLGTRSRRGWGSIWLANGPRTLEDFQTEVGNLELPENAAVIGISAPKNDWKQALNEAGKWLKQWRAGSTKSVSSPLKWGLNDHDATLGRNGARTTYRQAIGLPLAQRYSEGRGTYESKFNDSDRWASPIHIKVVRLDRGYCPIATFFPSMAIPENADVSVEDRKTRDHRTLTLSHGLLREMTKATNAYFSIPSVQQ